VETDDRHELSVASLFGVAAPLGAGPRSASQCHGSMEGA
jgi:hypothetical protein